MSEAKGNTVPGLGFKDKKTALETLKNLEGRDPDYQKLAVKGLIGRARRVLTLTKDKEKLENINTAMKIFDDFLTKYEASNMSKDCRAYLPLETIKILIKSNKSSDDVAKDFIAAYEKVKGDYKNLRTVESTKSEKTWDIVRNENLKEILKKYNDDNCPDLWDDDALPTKQHMQMIVWAYSPDAAKIKKNLNTIKDKLSKERKRSNSSDRSSDESPAKKSKK